MMYQDYWRLKTAAFENLPDPAFYFASRKHEEARQRLLRGIQERKGAVLLTGEIGCGKTLVSRTLIEALPASEYDVAVVVNPSLTAMDFLIEILYQFGLDSSGSKVELIHRINDRLLANHRQDMETLLLVDETQAVQDDRIFEDLRLLLNFQLNDRFLLTLVLLGQPELRARIAAIPQLNQRIAMRYHLEPFTSEETTQYVRSRLQSADGRPEIFTDQAILEIHQRSRGICRVINSLCDLCLTLGAEGALSQIDGSVVRIAGRMMEDDLPSRAGDLIRSGGWFPQNSI